MEAMYNQDFESRQLEECYAAEELRIKELELAMEAAERRAMRIAMCDMWDTLQAMGPSGLGTQQLLAAAVPKSLLLLLA
eukprot:4466367-Amphidinium_carterae.1